VEALVVLVAALVADPEAAEALVISRGFSKPPTFDHLRRRQSWRL
jgi:hypothetical protein